MGEIVEKRRVVITDENLGPVVSIVSIELLILVIITVFARLCIRYFPRRQLSLEDGLIVVAANIDLAFQIFSIGELVTVLGLDSNGLGSPRRVLSAEQVLLFEKYFYSNYILYVLNLGFSEISILLLIRNLTPVKKQKIAILVLIAFTALWAVVSVFALLFQCHSPHVWRFINNKCIDRGSFWIAYTAVHVVTEFALIISSVVLIWDLKRPRGTKALVIVPFTLRILVLVPAIAQLAYFLPTNNSTDPTFDLWTSVLCSQITQAVNIVTACFIQVKPFITSLHSGLLHNNDERRRIRQGSRSASNYVSLSAKGVIRSNRTGSDAKALTSETRNQFSGGRDPWDHYDEDAIEQVET
ncbi:hypothetical protein HYFRA_00000355 [Hymenoscyphus fraxineus]|uniref:Rhodopsin domain-containing protein n=1 Tax=Hymenoscyphus fraxineus TaxID=746836 RepID=A0A9N9PXU4_9HELO|nr:hypothetical protein HYFRA_00000355 [Hymenoscyphus fraxineus]